MENTKAPAITTEKAELARVFAPKATGFAAVAPPIAPAPAAMAPTAMPASAPNPNAVIIGTQTFESLYSVRHFFETMLARTLPGARVSADEQELLLALLKYHPKTDEKKGVGVDFIKAADEGSIPPVGLLPKKEPVVSHRFVIVRTDGSEIDFGMVKCVEAFKKSMLARGSAPVSSWRRDH